SGHLPSNEKLTEEKCIQLLTEKINSLNFANAKKDVEIFVKNGDLGLWSSEFFMDIIQRIKWMD
ncbi:MAG: nucleotidyl transferase AbiEii/AbiGii toxin family protein, partial [Candidatus Marinimicrobia bacterium]|nr:nucleotidyl transferase AbiEii/AbiGii toxin family protein [Candidatus Neomarinimicrobiota bacterium]